MLVWLIFWFAALRFDASGTYDFCELVWFVVVIMLLYELVCWFSVVIVDL